MMNNLDKKRPEDESWRNDPTGPLSDQLPQHSKFAPESTQAITFSEGQNLYEIAPEEEWKIKEIQPIGNNGVYESVNFIVANPDYTDKDLGFPVDGVTGMPFRVEVEFEESEQPNKLLARLLVRSIQQRLVVKKAKAEFLVNQGEAEEIGSTDIIDLGNDFKCSFSLYPNKERSAKWDLTFKPYRKVTQ